MTTIPEWDINGVLPAIRPGQKGSSEDRSPYKVTLMEIVERFSNTPERREILKGFLDYRKYLHKIGLDSGFQWLNGSFLEKVEIRQNRPPNDVDVVTFISLSESFDQKALLTEYPFLFNPKESKEKFHVDAYFVRLGLPTQQHFVKKVAYWYSMWSHTRARLWKGFVEIDLSSNEDKDCYDLLKTRI